MRRVKAVLRPESPAGDVAKLGGWEGRQVLEDLSRRPTLTAWSASCSKGRRSSYVSLAERDSMRGMKPVREPVQGEKKRPVLSNTGRSTPCTTLPCENAPPGI